MSRSVKPTFFTSLKGAHQWPLLEKLLQAKRAGYVDLALAERLMDLAGLSGEPVAALICHLSLACRKGHICVTVSGGSCIPSPDDVWTAEEHQDAALPAIGQEDMQQLSSLISEGARLVALPLPGKRAMRHRLALFPFARTATGYISKGTGSSRRT